jgi:hypothetical protein
MIAVIILASCTSLGNENWRRYYEDPIRLHRSMKQVTDVIIHDIFSPPVAGRIYAYVSVAAYEAIIAGNPTYLSLAGQLHNLETLPKPMPDLEYCFELAAVEAALAVGKALVFSEDKMDNFYNKTMDEFKASGIPEDVLERSISFGQAIANHVVEWADKDNYKQTRSFPKYTVREDPATWKPTPPAYMDGIEPHWNKLRTFLLDSASQFKPAPPTPFSTQTNSQFYKEAFETYTTVKTLTADQRQIASFWDCNPFVMNVKGHVMFATKLISPGGHWINITKVACQKSDANFAASAEAYMRVAISISDAFISCWDEKYRSNLIRPETYINQYIDENWVPLLQTPPFPEYSSGHSVISSAAAVTLTKLFGDNFAFTDSTEVEYGMGVRSFTSFIKASEEAAISRLYGGIHYRPAIYNGVTEGRAVGDFFVRQLKTRRVDLAKN